MEFRGIFNLGKDPTQKAWGLFALNLIFSAIIYAVMVTGIYFISEMILNGNIPMQYEYLVLATFLSMLVQFISATGQLVKVLYGDVDNELLIRFPLEGFQLFLSKSVFVFINTLIISTVFTLPFYVFYGIFNNLGALYYIHSVITCFFICLIPFFIASLISVPVMHVNNLIRNKFGLKLTFVILLIIIGFSIYMMLLRGILEYYQTQESNALFSEQIMVIAKEITKAMVPANFFANLLYGQKVWLSILGIFLFTGALGSASMYLGYRSYYPTLLRSIEKGREAFTKKTKNKSKSVFNTILHTEMLSIFRSFNYSFQYLAMAIAAPFMVYFCNNLAVAVGDSSVGGAIIPGLTILVSLIFDTIIVSFASTTISRMGENFFFTKVIPVSYKFQILVKLVLYMIVAGGSSLVTSISTWIIFGGEKFGNNIGIIDAISIFVISFFIIIALTTTAILSDMKSPTFDTNSDGDLVQANKNVTNTMILGVAISVLFGIFAMIFTYIPMGEWKSGINGVYIVLSALSFVLAGISILILFLKADKKYEKILP
jgi:ABC-2 type transport system permease protein